MQQHRIRRLVVDEGRYLAGIVTQSILLHALYPVEMQANVEKKAGNSCRKDPGV